MDDSELPTNRRESTTSRRTTLSDSGTRKPASIYEINDLYSALQDLVQSSPAPEHRRLKGCNSNFDSSDSWTSGTDSPDVRSRVGNQRKNMRVIRSSSSITQRFADVESPIEQKPEWRNRVKSPELKLKKLSSQHPPIDAQKTVASPKLALKKSRSDVSRLRSRSSVEGAKSMAEKIRDQRLKFTQGLKMREMADEEGDKKDKPIQNIDELVELAKMDEPGKKNKRKKPGQRKRLGSLVESGNKIKPNCSDSNLRSMDVTSRIDRWYERASALALGEIEDENESYESYSGSESDEISKGGRMLKKGKSLDDIDFGLDSFTADDLLSKWMHQKKNNLIAEERGISGSDTSVGPLSLDETDSSALSISREEQTPEKIWPGKEKSASTSPLIVNRIIVSQPSMDNSCENKNDSDVSCTNLPNQPIFYIPNFGDGKKGKATIISEKEEGGELLMEPARPRSRSAVSMGETFDRRDDAAWEEIQKISERRSKSFGAVNRRGSVEQVTKQERRDKMLRTTSEYKRKGPRPRSLNLAQELAEKTLSIMGEDQQHSRELNRKDSAQTDTNTNILQKDKKHDKGKKFSKLPGKLKTFLSGKKV